MGIKTIILIIFAVPIILYFLLNVIIEVIILLNFLIIKAMIILVLTP